jgi:hypothetical protein
LAVRLRGLAIWGGLAVRLRGLTVTLRRLAIWGGLTVRLRGLTVTLRRLPITRLRRILTYWLAVTLGWVLTLRRILTHRLSVPTTHLLWGILTHRLYLNGKT